MGRYEDEEIEKKLKAEIDKKKMEMIWICACGTENKGERCSVCNRKKPEAQVTQKPINEVKEQPKKKIIISKSAITTNGETVIAKEEALKTTSTPYIRANMSEVFADQKRFINRKNVLPNQNGFYWISKCGLYTDSNYCPDCGERMPVFPRLRRKNVEKQWRCDCGLFSTSLYCPNCGTKKKYTNIVEYTEDGEILNPKQDEENKNVVPVKKDVTSVQEEDASSIAASSIPDEIMEEEISNAEPEPVANMEEVVVNPEPVMEKPVNEVKTDYIPDYRDSEGYDKDGFNVFGYDRDGFDKDGYNRYGFDRNGYDQFGYDKRGYDKDGFDQFGYDKDGYNREGIDRFGLKKNQ